MTFIGRKIYLDKNLIGQKFGNLTIVDFTTVERGRQKCVCMCDCGNETLAYYRDLLSGHKKTCGLCRETAFEKYEYLIGQRINSWTVLDLDIRPKHYYAICECDCGTVEKVNIHNLISGYTKDCGCGRKRMLSRTRSKDLIGQRFGKLTAVEKLNNSNRFNRILYRCDCDCGNTIIVPSGSLTSGHTRSCGCMVSYYNMYIDTLLDDMCIAHNAEEVVNIEGHNCRFDFYLPDYNLMIEYDGEHHYKPITYGCMSYEQAEENLEQRRELDRLKDDYCYYNNINLLRIPYWEKEHIEEIINDYLQRLSERDYE